MFILRAMGNSWRILAEEAGAGVQGRADGAQTWLAARGSGRIGAMSRREIMQTAVMLGARETEGQGSFLGFWLREHH